MQISRIVTGTLPSGESGILNNSLVEPVSPKALQGLSFYPLWATDSRESLPDDGSPRPYWPDSEGTRFLAVTWAPADKAEPGDGEPEELLAQAEAALPGLMAAFEPDNPGYHTSHSIDYGVCLDGEMWLALDDGHEARITRGTVVIQRGTRHAWENRSDKPATMLYVLVGGDPQRY